VAHVPSGKHSLEHIYFSRLAAQKVLAVVVTKSGIVRDRVLRLQRELSQAELDTAARYINDAFQGWTIETLRLELARRLEQERSEAEKASRELTEARSRVENLSQRVTDLDRQHVVKLAADRQLARQSLAHTA